MSPFVLAELDYLISTRFGVDAELAVLGDLFGGAWTLDRRHFDVVRPLRGGRFRIVP